MLYQVAASEKFSASPKEIRDQWTLVDVVDAMLYLSLANDIMAAARPTK